MRPLITDASGVLGSELVLDSGRVAELGIRLRAPGDMQRTVATEAP